MKKFLSLVMALIMVMSLVTVASAADYKDAADIDSKEAVEVMSAVGVFQGSAGKFNPKAILNRAEAAKLIAYLDLGEKTAEALPAVQAFADVPTTHWAAKYVAYCADAGYINGVGNGKFDPTGKLTGYQFGKLLLCVLGYDATIEAFTGANWSIAVAKLMKANDIADGVDAAPSGELTREAAAQYCLNALQATMVEYSNKGTNITINGAVIATGASKAEPVTKAGSTAINATKTYGSGNVTTVELGEKLYDGDLTLTKNDTDKFGRPSVSWDLDGEEIGNYAEAAAAVFTADTSKTKVATALKGYTVEGYKVSTDVKCAASAHLVSTYNLDADATNSIAERLADKTANGAKVEVFANSDKEITKVVITNYDVVEVSNVSKKTNGDVYYTVKVRGTTITAIDYNENSSSKDNFVSDVELVKDGIYTYVTASDTYYFYPTTTVTGVVTEFDDEDYAIVDGTKYPLKGEGTVSVSSDKVELIIDQFGAIVKSDAVDKTSDVVYMKHVWGKKDAYGKDVLMAQFVDQTGKITEMEVDETSTRKVVGPCEYYVTSDDTAWVSAPDANTKKLQAGYGADLTTKTVKLASAISTYYYLADDVTFINMNGTGAKLKTSVATGAQKVDKAYAAQSYMVLDDGEVIAVFVPTKADSSVDQKDIIFVASDSSKGKSTDLDGKAGDLYEFYLNGEKVTKIAKFNGGASTGLFKYTVDSKTGRYTLTALDNTDGVYSMTVEKNDKGGVYNVARDAFLSFPGYSADMYDVKLDAECTFLDDTDNNIVDIPTLVSAVKNAPAGEEVKIDVFAVYNDKDKVITALYFADAE